ncbi:hypothetical protein ADIWIN_1148 [Winogradskyella psychrotolerans RS-3]|uniref:Uncharacterized protein n=1 Tax=Winogradskyella psychrotolerans RS-3 TaxID=641526 RepID=S7XCS1_9FLAO|nr:hypothetical protein [Winogradskyella psychrotolerans]EPR73788.1 hypothetical protein ADIWIN_1148 [Winogradskyella psychrotolerans RS-3]
MNKFRIRPKDDYIQEANWEQLFVLTEHWKSDLEFYLLDLEFLQHIIDKYFIRMASKKDIDDVREIETILVETTNNCSHLETKIAKHLIYLGNLIDDPFKNDSHAFRAKHEQLEDNIALFVKSFRKSRNDVFMITKRVLDGDTLSGLLK